MSAIAREAILAEAAACLADPDRASGDGALLVLADRLLLSGDAANAAIGELIAAQLATTARRPSGRRMRALAMAAVRAWLGPLAGGVAARTLAFDRGVPARATLIGGDAIDARDPLWPLLASVDLARAPVGRVLALLPALRRAGRVEGALAEVVLGMIGGHRPPAMTSLGCHLGRERTTAGWYITGGMVEGACAVIAADPGIRELRQGDRFGTPAYAWLATARLAALSVANLDERTRRASDALALEPWLAWLHAAPTTLARFELTEHVRADFDASGGWTVAVTRGARTGAFDTVHASCIANPVGALGEPPAQRFATGWRRIPAGTIARLTFTTVSPEIRDDLARLGITAF